MNSLITETKYVDVRVGLVDGKIAMGKLNIIGHDRLTDFIEKEDPKFLKLAHVSHNGSETEFMMIRARSWEWIKPLVVNK